MLQSWKKVSANEILYLNRGNMQSITIFFKKPMMEKTNKRQKKKTNEEESARKKVGTM